MFFLQVHFEYQGTAGLIVGIILGIGTLIGVVKLAFWFWGAIVAPLRTRWQFQPTQNRRLAFLEFKQLWIIEHNAKAIFVLDDKKRCVSVNDVCAQLLRADSSDVLGRRWHSFVKESHLTSTLQKWNEAYEHQGPYRNISILVVDGEEKTFIVHAEPFIYKDKVHNYIGTLMPFEAKTK